ncbi:MAG: aspartate aminotransferase family protein [Actinobacteria bacterium]|nr:MAG: aspartate aminotransferase family protein [Actinomycetota bacterium]
MNKIIELDKKYHMNTYARLPVVFVKGNGVYIYDDKGRKYLDFISGLGVVNLGHSPKAIIDVAKGQLDKLTHVSNLIYTKPQALLGEKLIGVSLKNGRVFFANSGAEANEAAVKLLRRWAKINGTAKPEIITAYNSFHGRTLKMVAASGQVEKQKPYEPLPPGFKHVKYNDIAALKKAVNKSTTGVMLEVIQGEGGVYCADKKYLKEVAELCRKKGMLLILDEVQTGLCRTGKFFAYQNYGIKPDILTVAKALGNGLPIGAAIASNKVASSFKKGDHGSTFGGGPVVSTVALKVLDIMKKKELHKKAAQMGKYLSELVQDELSGHITDIRGCGLMIGLQLKEEVAAKVVKKSLEKGLIINNIGESIIRFLPPLIISKKDCQNAVKTLKNVLEEL